MNQQEREWLQASLDKIGETENRRLSKHLKAMDIGPTFDRICPVETAVKRGTSDSLRKQAIAQNKAYEYALVEGPNPLTRTAACAQNKAYLYALRVDKKPTRETRLAACGEYALKYALYVDKKPHPVTRRLASAYGMGFEYAVQVDNCRTNVTARGSDGHCIRYAKFFDNGNPTEETRRASWTAQNLLIQYIREIEKGWHPKTVNFLIRERKHWILKVSLCIDLPHDSLRKHIFDEEAYEYAKSVDKEPHRVTRLNAESQWGLKYAFDIDKGPHPVTYINSGPYRTAYIRRFGPVSKWIHRFLGPKASSSLP